MATTIETELKLQLPPSRNAAFRRLMKRHALPELAPETSELVSIYYDTPEFALAERGMSLRLRQADGQWWQTLKLAERAGHGLCQRPELSVPLDGAELVLSRIAKRRVRQFLERIDIAAALQPRFTTTVKRTRWRVEDEQGNRLSVCLDQGTIQGAGQTQKFNEVEIELLQGSVQALFDLALQWVNTLPLIPEIHSKAERGYALCRSAADDGPAKAQWPALKRKQSPERAQHHIVEETLRHLQANVPGILARNEVECVHQARVALRRLRSAQKAFAALPEDPEWGVITTKAQWLAGLLGQVRDLDVFLDGTLPGIEQALAGSGDFVALRTALQQQREAARREAHTALQSPRYGALLLHLLAWLHRPSSSEPVPQRLDDFAGRALKRRRRSVGRLAQSWATLDAEQRHTLRKQAKKLRYSVEFFSPLYPAKSVRRYLVRLQQLQQRLGELNDGIAAQSVLNLAVEQDGKLTQVAALAAGWLAHQASQAEAPLLRDLARWKKARPFW